MVEARFRRRSELPAATSRPGFDRAEALRWLVVPVAVAVFVVVGLAVAAEDRQAFRDDEVDDAPPPDTAQSEPATAASTAQGSGSAAPSPGSVGEADQRNGTGPTGDEGPVGAAPTVAGGDHRSGPVVATITSPAGAVVVDLAGERPVVSAANPGGTGDQETVLDGGAAAVLFTADGSVSDDRSEPVAAGEVAIVGDGRAVELVTTGGERFRLAAPTDDPTTIAVTRDDGSGPDAVTPEVDGTVDLGDGVTLQVPVPVAGADGSGARSVWEEAAAPPWRWVIVAVLTVVALWALWARPRPRRHDEQPGELGELAPAGVPPERFDDFVAMLAADDDPARAIRLAFHAAERGMGQLPPRYSTETPFEWFQRAVEWLPGLADPLGSLCNRFATARFAPDRPTEADRDAALADLVDLHRLARGGDAPAGGDGRLAATGLAAGTGR